MTKTLRKLQHLENLVLVITFAVMVIAIFAQVINRNFFKIPVSGFEEAAKYCMVYMVMLGTELGLRDGTQIAVTGVVDRFHGKAHKILLMVAKVIVIAFAAIMTNTSLSMVLKQVHTGQTSPGLGIPLTVPYFALLLSFALITVIQAALLVQMIRNFNKPEEEEAAAIEETAASGKEVDR